MSNIDDAKGAFALRDFLYLLVFVVCFISGAMAAINQDVWRELGYLTILAYMVAPR